jgi:hypothetical protein
MLGHEDDAVEDGSTPEPASGPTPTSVEALRMRQAVRSRLFGAEGVEPVKIGRFMVLRRVGEGGMGVVFAAYDEQLDRKVAIKLLRTDAAAGSEGRARLQREAQALARLSHPNVVGVFEVGTFEEQVFVAMEFVRGATARAWLSEARRSWRDIVDVYAQAGRGLAAAHAAGMVHRDFKPDNVLVGEDGRVRVADFGLAREAESREDARRVGETTASVRSPAVLTRTGAVMGTPAYMSPEQHVGKAADARSDQFALCIALWEALFGERPFAGETVGDLALSVARGEIRPPREGSRVPRRIRRALERGLAAKPEARWPSVNALVEALVRDTTRRAGWIGAVSAMVLLTSGFAWWSAARDACPSAHERLAGVWDEPRKLELMREFDATGVPEAPERWSRAAANFDAFVIEWTQVYADACALPRDDQTRPLALRCLDDRLIELREVVASLASPDELRVAYTIHASSSLTEPRECKESERLVLLPRPPEDPQAAAEYEDVQAQITRADALWVVGREDEGAAIAQAAIESARGLGAPVLEARALWMLGLLREDPATLAAATNAALAAGDERVAARAAAVRAGIMVGHELEWPPAELHSQRALHRSLAQRTQDPYARAVLLELDGQDPSVVLSTRENTLRDCIEIDPEGRRGPVAQVVTRCRRELAWVLLDEGDAEGGLRQMREQARQREAVWGPHHGLTTGGYHELAAFERALGHTEAAREAWRAAWEISLENEDTGAFVFVAPDLAEVERCLHGIAKAEALLIEAENVLERRNDAAHVHAANLAIVRAEHAILRGDIELAEALVDRADAEISKSDRQDWATPLNLAVRRADLHALRNDGPGALALLAPVTDAVSISSTSFARATYRWGNLTVGHVKQFQYFYVGGQREAAVVAAGLALATAAWLPALDPKRHLAAGAFGTALVELGHYAVARRILEPAHALRVQQCPRGAWLDNHSFTTLPAFALARARWETGARAEALALAGEVRDDLAELGPGRDADRMRVEQWIAARSR